MVIWVFSNNLDVLLLSQIFVYIIFHSGSGELSSKASRLASTATFKKLKEIFSELRETLLQHQL